MPAPFQKEACHMQVLFASSFFNKTMDIEYFILLVYTFINDVHVLLLRSRTIVLRLRMNFDNIDL